MRRQELVLTALLAGLAWVAAVIPQPRTVDDAFITFRYSRNLVEGHGFVYNLDDRVLGTTTPLYTGIMALCGAIFGENYPLYALHLNALAHAGTAILIFLIARHLAQNQWIAAWLGAAWAIAPFAVTFAIGGMETSLHNLFMLGAWWAYLQHRPGWMGAMCAFGFLTRPDALIWALPLLLQQLWQTARTERGWQRLPLQTWGIGLIIVLPWLIFAALYFGSPLPHTISTKAAVYDLPATQALGKFLYHYATPFQEGIALQFAGIIPGLVGVILYPALALIGLRAVMARERRALPILIYPWLYALIFIIANPLIFRWYLTPLLPAYFIAIGCGIGALLELAGRPRITQGVLAGIALLTLLFTLSAWELHPDHGPERPAPRMAFHELELNYQYMALTLREEYGVNEDTVLAAADIGALGFYSRAFIYDTIGLVTEGTVPYYEDQAALDAIRAEEFNYVIPPDLILDRQPEYVVVMELFLRNGLLKDPRFLEQYELIEEIPTDYYGTGMLAFRRIDTQE